MCLWGGGGRERERDRERERGGGVTESQLTVRDTDRISEINYH